MHITKNQLGWMLAATVVMAAGGQAFRHFPQQKAEEKTEATDEKLYLFYNSALDHPVQDLRRIYNYPDGQPYSDVLAFRLTTHVEHEQSGHVVICDARTGVPYTATEVNSRPSAIDDKASIIAVIPARVAIYLGFNSGPAIEETVTYQMNSGQLSKQERDNVGACRRRTQGLGFDGPGG